MAEGFEPYHVPQQSRREKLRIINITAQDHHQTVDPTTNNNNNLQGCAGLLPLCDPSSFIPPDLLTSHGFHPQSLQLLAPINSLKQNPCSGVKEEGVNLMGFVGGTSANTNAPPPPHTNNPYSNVEQGNLAIVPLNPIPLSSNASIHDINSHSIFFSAQNARDFDNYSHQHLQSNANAVATTGQGLSLSLSSQQQSHQRSGNLPPLELNLQRYIGDVARCSVPLGPFTGYASILKGSRFLKPAQQMLEEICDVGHKLYAEKMVPDSSLLDPPPESLSGSGIVDDPVNSSDGGERKRTKSKLISMLEEVYRRYKQYYQQLQTVVVSFESVAGLSNAAPFTSLAFKTMSKHFRCLRNAITEQLQSISKTPSNLSSRNDAILRSDSNDKGSIYAPRPLQSAGLLDHQPVWRPQRGLPERAVSVLRAWLFEHFLHPYPTDSDKLMLARQTGLSRSQVSNWFINARVRLWKPMVEEIHALETRQVQKASQREELDASRPTNHVALANSDNPSTSAPRNQDPSFKRMGNDLPDLPGVSDHQMSLQFHHSLPCTVGGSSGVSLTLGLHQNNGIGLQEPFPINVTHRFGLSGGGDQGCVMGGFEPPNRLISGQYLHDFVG
ncbi:BEL1-like homeodomain protein [Ancistrocladus abbreviatus]